MTRIYILSVFLLSALLCQAQLPTEGGWQTRLGVGKQEKAKELYEYVFHNASSPVMKGNERKPIDLEFYVNFKKLTQLAPYCDIYLYNGYLYEGPTSLYRRMLDSISDPAVKMILVEDVMEHAKMYDKHLDSINVLRSLSKEGGKPLSPLAIPMAKIKRAHYNYMFAHNPKYYPSHLYNREKAHELYRDAFREFVKSQEEMGETLPAYYVQEYFKACIDLYESDTVKYYEQFLNDYQEVVQVCDKLLARFYEIPDSIKLNPLPTIDSIKTYQQYSVVRYGIDSINGMDGVKVLFDKSGAGAPNTLRAYYAPRLGVYSHNKDTFNLDVAIHHMSENNYPKDSLFYKYCKASYDSNKTFKSTERYAGVAYALKYITRDSLRNLYVESLKYPASDLEKAKIHYRIARSLFTTPPTRVNAKGKKVYVSSDSIRYQVWEGDIETCIIHLEKMLESANLLLDDPKLAVRDYVKNAYFMLGDSYRHIASRRASSSFLGHLDKAQDYYIKAKRRNYKADIIDKCIGVIKDVRNEIAKRAQDIAEYEEYMRKKKAEEAFWNAK